MITFLQKVFRVFSLQVLTSDNVLPRREWWAALPDCISYRPRGVPPGTSLLAPARPWRTPSVLWEPNWSEIKGTLTWCAADSWTTHSQQAQTRKVLAAHGVDQPRVAHADHGNSRASIMDEIAAIAASSQELSFVYFTGHGTENTLPWGSWVIGTIGTGHGEARPVRTY